MERKEQLTEIFKDLPENKRVVINELIEEFVFIEKRLKELRKLPHIRIHPKNHERQETTPAGKQYKELMQSYLNALKVLQKTLYIEGVTEDSPLLKALQVFQND